MFSSLKRAGTNRKGFTLVEMAIVLVIIGIIIGAVVKGQDLIINAQAKQATAAVTSWRNLAMAYLDRNGRMPGDNARNGVIGDVAGEQTAAASSIGEITSTMQYPPANPVIVGGMNFWVYVGNTTNTSSTNARNAMLVCGDAACANVFSADQLEIIKSMDAAFDGSADAGVGQFRAVTTAPTLVLASTTVNTNWVTAVFTGNGVTPVVTTAAGTATAWATTHRAAIWFFDRTI